MTENEAIELLNSFYEMDEMYAAAQVAIQALEEIQQYRAIGTVEQLEWCKDASHWKELFKEKLEQYRAIGTIEEFKALKVTQKMIEKSNFCLEQYRADTDTAYQCGYNKAIDEFAELLKGNLVRRYANSNLTQQYVALQVTDWCNEIAEQLKAGGKDD